MKAPRRNLTFNSKRVGLIAVLVAAIAAVVVIAANSGTTSPNRSSAQTSSEAAPKAKTKAAKVAAPTVAKADVLPTKTASYLGVHESEFPNSYSQTTGFKNAVGRWPNVALYYSGWPQRFEAKFASKARSHGAVTLVDIDPGALPMKSISDGSQDWYVKELAAQVKAYGHPVMISFGHEMNGTWYKWGSGHTEPSEFIAAWRHIYNVFQQQGAKNVTWVWTVSAYGSGKHPVTKWYPGNKYVSWAAIDGYVYRKFNDFSNTFGPTIKQVRAVAKGKPIFISETAVGQVAGQAAKIPNLIAGVKNNKLLGLLWFDKDQGSRVMHQNWRIEGNKKAEAAFRSSLKKNFSKLSSTAH